MGKIVSCFSTSFGRTKLPLRHSGLGALERYRFERPSRFFLAGEAVMVGTVRQLEDDAMGCGGGVGETPWNHVDVP